ncbi:MAG: glutamyl-tRNA reductase [Bacteroidetes bacterium]|nr:glutamyl-tRNA reductase [Bacteroidota bacterium]MBU1115910.1 glutamyl-tRNA reductase [Bacteroidota bacterium]MBU1798731.1 glutamyl-tRNA reductase [Bacteroidota bacterium]
MDILGISINHKTAPIGLREALHLSQEEILEFTPILKEHVFSEGYVLSTCNRTDIFGIPKSGKISYKDIQKYLLDFKHVDGLSSEHFLNYFSCGAVKHVLEVASSINSLIVGDSQIHGQVKEAFLLSEDLGFSKTLMHKLFEAAVRVGKRTITETRIGEGAVTISYAGIKILEKIFSTFETKAALVIGAGETGELAAKHLRESGIGKLSISNRTLSKSELLASKVNSDVIPFENVKESLHKFDIIVTATSADGYILEYEDIKKMMKLRKGKMCSILDIALPRDVDPKVTEIDGIFYNDIDSLNIIVNENLKNREKEIPIVDNIIMEEMTSFFKWYNTLNIVPTIKDFRDFFEEIRKDEVEKIKYKVHDYEYEKVDNMTKRIIGRILHYPTWNLKRISETGTNFEEAKIYSDVIRELFNLDHKSENNSDDTFYNNGAK